MTWQVLSLILGILFLAVGILFFKFPQEVIPSLQKGLRQKFLGNAMWTLAGMCFLSQIYQLSASDFGQYRGQLMLFFGALIAGGFFFLEDFLIVRGAAVLLLLLSRWGLDLAYCRPESGRLLFVGLIYLGILLEIYLGLEPYRVRDFFAFLEGKNSRCALFSGLCSGVGLIFIAAVCY